MLLFTKKSLSLLSIVSIFFVLLSGCHSTPQNTDNLTTNSSPTPSIDVYSASMHSLKLPLKDTCYDTMNVQRFKVPDSLSNYAKYGQVIGKVNETKKYTAILYAVPADVQLPVLYVFDKKGRIISSLKLFIGDCCGENEDCSGMSTVEITEDLHIILKDSVQTFERDKKQTEKKRNIKILKKQQEFKIDSTGKIILSTAQSRYSYSLS